MYYENPKGVAVHDGFPNAATDTSIQTLDLNKLLIKNSVSTYFMRAVGNDWQPYGIEHGDIILIDRAVPPRANSLVVWWHEETFQISPKHAVPSNRQVWGSLTAIIRQLEGGQV